MAHPSAARPNVFISSTTRDLPDHRKAAMDATWRCDMYPIAMERDTASPKTPEEYSLDLAEQANVYVGIFAHRYGYIPATSDISITEMEYRRAKTRGIPILIFMTFEDMPAAPDDEEHDPAKAAKLEHLKDELRTSYVVGFFRSPAELEYKVFHALSDLRAKGVLTPSDAPASPHARTVKAIATPPQPYYAHPYILGRSFFGREAELYALDEWGAARDPMLIVDAIGGAGKSALTWHWTQSRAQAVIPELAGSMWWSFYESDATMGNFLAHALAYLTGRPVDETGRIPRAQVEQTLLQILRQRPYLLVLDGIERVLQAYHRGDASQVADDQLVSSSDLVAEQKQPRACVDPRDGAFLRQLSQCGPSKILVSTRLIPLDLADRAGQPLPGVHVQELHGLKPEDALAMLHGLGVRGADEQMRVFTEQFGYHPLIVEVVAGYINGYRPAPGDFDAWYHAEGVKLRLKDQDLTQRRSSILQYALDGLSLELFHFLCQVAAFRYPVDLAALSVLNPYALPPSDVPPSAEQAQEAQERFFHALDELEQRGLLQWDRAANRYDLHPVVRAYAFERLGRDERKETFGRIRDYFERLPPENEDDVRDVSDLRRTLEIYHALLGAGLYDQAIKVYKDRLDVLYYGLGTYHTIIELLTPLFPRGYSSDPVLTSPRDQSYAINDLSICFANLGDIQRALALDELGIGIKTRNRNASNLPQGLSNYGDNLLEGGYLAASERAVLFSLEFSSLIDSREVDASNQELIRVYATMGSWKLAEAKYRLSTGENASTWIKQSAHTSLFFIPVIIGLGGDPASMLDTTWARSVEQRNALAMRRTRELQGEFAFEQKRYSQAEGFWLDTLSLAQRSGIPLAACQANLARLCADQGRLDEARHLIEQAFTDGQPILAAAEVYLALGERMLAKDYALQAYKRAWADGPPYIYYRDLQRAKKVLATLGLAEPKLPPYDPARVRPIAHEAEIRAYIQELQTQHGTKPSTASGTARESRESVATRRGGWRWPWQK